MPPSSAIERSATLSEDGRYRYALWRRWGEGSRVVFVMLNPSTADAEQDDPTIRKCIGFAQRWGHEAIGVVNLYAYRATKPKDLWQAAADGIDIVGSENDDYIERTAVASNQLVLAWGANVCNADARRAGLATSPEGRANMAMSALRTMGAQTLGFANCKQPRHPLMLAYSTPLVSL